ncbi:MAG: hypothetical protein QY303_04315 [Vicingaceae bacterium]|nr:MAG: hypothetical protein QY303_04315 [Vicingaceae bacterium]
MKTVTIKSLYSDFLQVPFPTGLAGQTIDGIDLALFDTELAGDISQFVDNPNYLSQDQIKKYIRKTQYLIERLKDEKHLEYFEQWEFILMNCLTDFDKSILKRYIRQDLQSVDTLNNLHGIDLENIQRHLVDPTLKEYYNDFQNKVEKHWVVLDEEPQSSKDGYQIVYSVEHNEFGLAVKTSNTKPNVGTLVGWYGSFVSALNCM